MPLLIQKWCFSKRSRELQTAVEGICPLPGFDV
jgi:hypothetical protein